MLTKNEKFIFFITSYTPMWSIFLLKIYFTEKNTNTEIFFYEFISICNTNINIKQGIMIFLVLLIFFSIYKLLNILNPKDCKSSPIKIISVKNISIDYLTNYFSLYLFPFFALEIVNILTIVILIIILLLSSYLYVKNNILYINPILNLLGYSIYDVEIELNSFSEKKITRVSLITKREKYEIPEEISVLYKFEDNIYFEK